MAKFLVFNPVISASEILMSMDISTTTHSINCKPILPIRQLYKTTMTMKASVKMAEMTPMKTTVMMTMMLINRQKRNKRLGVAGTLVLIVIQKK